MLLLDLLSIDCPWLCAPNDPSTPFGSPVLIVVDTVRVLAFLAMLGVLALTPGAIARCHTVGQKARFIALDLFGLSVLTANADHLGDYLSLGTLVNLIAALCALFGMWSYRSESPGDELRPGRLRP